MKATNKIFAFALSALLATTAFMGCELSLGDGDQRASVSGLNVTDLTITGQVTSFEQGESFSFGSNAVITATYIDDSTETLSSDDVEVTGFTTDTVGENIATVKVSYTSGSVTETAEYKITVTLAVTKIEVTGVETAYVYNPGALDTALDTAFTYEITATYSDGTTDSLDASKCTIAVNSTNDGIIASYTSAANGELTDEYTSDEIKTAISSFTVESGYALGDSDCSASWIASTDIKIPVGKTIVATFKNYGSGNNNYNNFLLEFTIPGGSGITARADNYGWNYASEGTAGEDIDYAEATTSTTVTDWETWLAVIKNGADIICIAENNGTTLDITCTSTTEGLTDWIQKYSVPFKTDLAKSAGVNFHFNIDGAYLVFD